MSLCAPALLRSGTNIFMATTALCSAVRERRSHAHTQSLCMCACGCYSRAEAEKEHSPGDLVQVFMADKA